MIKAEIKGIEELRRYLEKLPVAIRLEATRSGAKYLVDYLRQYPKMKHVSRAEAYPDAVLTTGSGKTIRGYFSWKQFRFVMALVATGKTPYARTNNLQRGWRAQQLNQYAWAATNRVNYAKYVQGTTEQSRHESKVGWKTAGMVVQERSRGLSNVIIRAAKKAIRDAKR